MADEADNDIGKKVSLITKRRWVREAKEGLRQMKADAWRCNEAVDGKLLTDKDYTAMIGAGIPPLDLNRIFPVIGVLSGSQIVNSRDIIAEGRTAKDSEIQQIMTEGIKYVMDQNSGEFLVSSEFLNAITGGLGYIAIEEHTDPRKENIRIRSMGWENMWYDPFSKSPWADPETCRYMFYNPWMDLDELIGMFPDKANDIKAQFTNFSSMIDEDHYTIFDDEGTEIEEEKKTATAWVNVERKRVRPIEMWYTRIEKAVFAIFKDGSYTEIDEKKMDPRQIAGIFQIATKIYPASIKRMYVSIFFGDVELTDERSSLPHDQFKYVPLVGYTDRFGFAYGVPQQLIGLNIEVIKRRSMALEMMKSRRVIAEEDAAPAGSGPQGLEAIYKEAQKLDGLIVVAKGALGSGKIHIDEQVDLITPQLKFSEIMENEIKEISAINDEMQGLDGRSQSGKAMNIKIQRSATTTAPLFNNLSRSLKMMGEQIQSLIQGTWTGEKVLRITDRITGAKRFVELNKAVELPDGSIVVRNDITQGRYDITISEAPKTDTVRERNLQLVSQWMEKEDDPRVKGILLNVAMELTDLPNKEAVLAQIKPLRGIMPGDEDKDAEQIKAEQEQQVQAQAQQQQLEQQIKNTILQLDVQTRQATLQKILKETAKLAAETEKIGFEADMEAEQLNIDRETADADNYSKGVDVAHKLLTGGQQDQKGKKEKGNVAA